MDLMERRGSGLRKIIEAYETEENYKEELKPEFISTESSFITVLKNLNYATQSLGDNDTQNDTQNVGQNEGQKLKSDQRRKKIVEIMRDNLDITSIELANILNVSVSTIERDLKILTDEKTIEFVGSAKSGYWKVNE